MSDEHEVRDHALSRVYREGAWPEPSRQIDQAILAASRRAARERHPLLWRWAPSFAVAATVVLTSAIVLKAYRERPDVVSPSAPEAATAVRDKQAAPVPKAEAKAEAKVQEKPSPPPPPAQPTIATPKGFSQTMDTLEAERLERAKRDLDLKELTPPDAASAARLAKKPAAEPPQRRADAPQAQKPSAPPPQLQSAPVSVFGAQAPATATAAPASAPQAPRAVVAKPTQTAVQAPRVQANEASPAAQAAPQPPAADEAKPAQPAASAAAPRNVLGATVAGAVAAKPAERSPQTWIEDIRKLMKEGKSEEAGEQLAEFKKRYPDYALPEDLR